MYKIITKDSIIGPAKLEQVLPWGETVTRVRDLIMAHSGKDSMIAYPEALELVDSVYNKTQRVIVNPFNGLAYQISLEK